MRMTESYEFRAPFSLCDFAVWEDLDREFVGGGGRDKREKGGKHVRRAGQRLPVLFCAVFIILLSVESYVAVYAIVGALTRSVHTFWF
jgi:hypothetical protein